jgi:hypothetical protein
MCMPCMGYHSRAAPTPVGCVSGHVFERENVTESLSFILGSAGGNSVAVPQLVLTLYWGHLWPLV